MVPSPPGGRTRLSPADAVAVIGSLFLFPRLRSRRKGAEPAPETPRFPEDRAFNELRIVRAGADHLERQGHDVSAVRRMLEEAEAARRRRDADGALHIAERARTTLHAIQEGGGALPPEAPDPSPAGTKRFRPTLLSSAPAEAPPDREAGEEEPPRPRLPTHQVEARFALTELDRNLATAPAGQSGTEEARALGRQAQEAYARASYTEAWSLALRGRRRLGAKVESLPAPRVAPVGRPETATPTPGAGVAPGPASVGSGAAACPSCGQAVGGTDQFCRACGAALRSSACARCGAPNVPRDRFCGRCGQALTE